jgi:hypothetical protein
MGMTVMVGGETRIITEPAEMVARPAAWRSI